MGDYIVDFRPRDQRTSFVRAAAYLKFQEHVSVETIENDDFSLALSTVDNPVLWGSHHVADIFAAVCGRIDLEESEWVAAEKIDGYGGLASKYVAAKYREGGVGALETFSGNFAILLWDKNARAFFIVGDLCGALPLFKSTATGKLAFGSHADALARAIDEEQSWDEVSLTEFLLTSGVTPPHTYYKNIRSLPEGAICRVDLKVRQALNRQYFTLEYRGNPATTDSQLAEELASNIVASVRKRTLSRLGPVAVALSGGLDSRTILAAAPDRSNVFAFCCFNEENNEFAIARDIARALNVKLVPLTRNFDYYGDNAALGIRIAGGMGTFANNHFLGVSQHLRELGAQNLLTGCYCDYLFKALPLNTSSGRLFRQERLARYNREFYFYHYRMDRPAATAVCDRIDSRIPQTLWNSKAPEKVFELERLRTFPLFQEGDNAQRLVPQRVLYSYLPVADRAILETYCRIPYQFKLNRSLFKKTVARICGPSITKIPDANTGAPADATLFQEAFTSAKLRLRRKLKKNPGIATQTSWPDWNYYVAHSDKLKAMWQEPCEVATDIFRKLFTPEDIRPNPADYTGRDIFLFVQMLSLKLWLKDRCSNA